MLHNLSKNIVPKLSEYVEIAAAEYLQETGNSILDIGWIAEFYQDAGVLDDYPRQDLVAFANLVQKALDKKVEAPRIKFLSVKETRN